MVAPGDIQVLYLRHGREIRRYLVRRIACADTAAELAQEVFMRLIGSRTPRSIQDQRAYLYRIAANLVTDHIRHERRTPPLLPDDLLRRVSDEAPTPERRLLDKDQVRRLEQAIDELPPRRREIFLLHKFEGLTYGEIAERLGISKNTIMVQMMKALAHCRDRLADER